MIQFERFRLANGLRVLVHEDHSTPMVAVNVLYDVGARDENPEQTGFAHLFEHLMFGGSVHIPSYDEPLQMAGGENNAYTTNDITNYYIQLPVQNVETALWLESDRMLSLAFGEKSLEVQRKVVCEEFKEHYINKPYGDAMQHLRALAYTRHPYQWMTIGKNLKQIEDATLEDVRAFFFKHYRPVNAVLCVAGDITTDQVRSLSERWFGDIEAGEPYTRALAPEPRQESPRTQTVMADVPLDALYKAYHIPGRLAAGYYSADLLTEIVGSGYSSRLYQRLVKEEQLFSNISCYQTGSLDPGLLIIEGKIREGQSVETASAAVDAELDKLMADGVAEAELNKAKNKLEAAISFEDMSLLSRANNLAFYELLGDAELMNTELDRYRKVTAGELLQSARELFREGNRNTLLYRRRPDATATVQDDEETEEE